MRPLLLASFAASLLTACASPQGGGIDDDDGGPADPSADPQEITEQVTFPDRDATGDDPAHRAVLPACASPLATRMFDATRDVIWRGTVPGDHYATARNAADTDALIDGPQIFPKFRELIAGANYDVVLQTYVWEVGSDPANEILAGLTELARRRAAEAPTAPPVTVRFLIDASTVGFGSSTKTLPQLQASVDALGLDPARVRFELAAFYHIAFGNLHVKTLVVDGRDAIITGANPQAHHNYDAPWRDSGYHLTGDVAVSLLADFDSAWRRGSLWTCGGDEAVPFVDCMAVPERPIYTVRRGAVAADTCRTMLVITRQPDQDPTANRTDNTQDQALLAGFAAATTSIHMQTPNLNDDAAKTALLDAVKRGVQVDIVLSRGFNDVSEGLAQGGDNDMNVRMLYDDLAAAHVTGACDKLRVRWYSHDGRQPTYGNGYYASHAKYASIDDQVVVVGTANMDTQSWNNSREVNVAVDDRAIATAWDAQLFLPAFTGGIRTVQCPAP